MDIQKIKELALANGFKLKEQASGNMDLNSYVYDFANAIEQAAKAQAVPDGFVVVPKEPTQELLNKMQDFFVGAFENGLTGGQSIHCAYIAMIEAASLSDVQVKAMGQRARQRIVARFSLDRTVDSWLDIYAGEGA